MDVEVRSVANPFTNPGSPEYESCFSSAKLSDAF